MQQICMVDTKYWVELGVSLYQGKTGTHSLVDYPIWSVVYICLSQIHCAGMNYYIAKRKAMCEASAKEASFADISVQMLFQKFH